ncbi:hypothetical protein L596_020944 [Steinernema carpocapsae]|uniref:Uncharacterized protein n=1 Tax=Steinernema carpocapsae TaxID=34508 RepID=A0A4U5MV16_STECR|nr:hypothetical protein L596_020944 [Steinernema carpocapsae]
MAPYRAGFAVRLPKAKEPHVLRLGTRQLEKAGEYFRHLQDDLFPQFLRGAANQAIKDGTPLDEVMRFVRWKQQKTLEAYVEVSPASTPTTSNKTLVKLAVSHNFS